MKFLSLFFAFSFLVGVNTYASTHINCEASISEYVLLPDGTSEWKTEKKIFSIESKNGDIHVVSSIKMGNYEVSAVLRGPTAYQPPASSERLALSIIRKDDKGILKFHTNSSIDLPIAADRSFNLTGWDFSGRYEKFDIAISLSCK